MSKEGGIKAVKFCLHIKKFLVIKMEQFIKCDCVVCQPGAHKVKKYYLSKVA